MDREIKFRAWDAYEKKMIEWNDLCNPLVLTISNLLNGLIHHITPLQFTGLKDRKGKDIYEGDIAKTGNGRLWIITMGEYTYLDEGPRIGWHLHSKTCDFPLRTDNMIYVLGDIYENPELLK